MKALSDSELMELVKYGDFAAFDELYNRYSGPIKRFLYSLTWDEDLAEDYVQEVFFRLFRARCRYKPTGKFSTYLFQIAKNYYLTQRRKAKAGKLEVSLTLEHKNGFKPFDNIIANRKIEPEIHLLESYRMQNIRRAIQLLPENQKLVFVMSHFESMKYQEIAEVLNIPIGTVKSRMFSAVATLKTLLKEDQS